MFLVLGHSCSRKPNGIYTCTDVHPGRFYDCNATAIELVTFLDGQASARPVVARFFLPVRYELEVSTSSRSAIGRRLWSIRRPGSTSDRRVGLVGRLPSVASRRSDWSWASTREHETPGYLNVDDTHPLVSGKCVAPRNSAPRLSTVANEMSAGLPQYLNNSPFYRKTVITTDERQPAICLMTPGRTLLYKRARAWQ